MSHRSDRLALATRALSTQLVCPLCKTPLRSVGRDRQAVQCANCGAAYGYGDHCFDFTPPADRRDHSPRWDAWRQVEENGLVGYTVDPERNLSIGERMDCQAFAQFCRYRGLILDVGCGPQRWPAYFLHTDEATYVGIDPLADRGPADFLKFVGLGEYLPFAASTFDQVLFSTTLDHFVDPCIPLREAARVLRSDGEIDVWLGEKDPGPPVHAESPPWYTALQRPPLAEDVFHLARLSSSDFHAVLDAVGLRTVEESTLPIDEYRRHRFYRVRRA